MSEGSVRLERDSMGEMEVPASAYYGASTQRAVANFPISQLRLPRRMITALGDIKREAARVNAELGLLPADLSAAIAEAADQVSRGDFDGQFVVDIFQTGSGTSSNMNANEVITNRALELLGQGRGSRNRIHPNDHVNLGQSSNDVFPSAIHLAALAAMREELVPGLEHLGASLETQRDRLWAVIKTGRTHLQDATPIRMGQEFEGYLGQVQRALARLDLARRQLVELALGGTAVGTGIGTHAEFAKRVIARLAPSYDPDLHESNNHFQAQSSLDAVVFASGAVRGSAIAVHKIASDLRLLSFGPRAGVAELRLPEVQPGSSIMPGKVNPVILESALMVVAQVLGDDATVAFCGATGSLLELNVMLPVAAYNLLEEIELLARAATNLAGQAVDGISATDRGPALLEQGLAICTALVPTIGYDAAAAIAHEAYQSDRTVREVALERSQIAPDELDRLLDPEHLVVPGLEVPSAG
ncbi:MAG TPA: class II fumarate hydratase [Candidatus Nanopelagicaceae bacterium]|nr:class II fumarate hydratase [Candidatus Nanopelagicaceae bacterium]